MLVAVIFGGFLNITIWQRLNLEILWKESGWGSIFFHLVTTNFLPKFINSPILPNKSSPIIYRFTVFNIRQIIEYFYNYVKQGFQFTSV